VRGAATCGAEFLQKRSILVKHREVLRQRFNVAYLMYKPCLQVFANSTGRIGNKQNTPTTTGLVRYKSAPFFYARENQRVALSH
jgi:hypothetical protein